MGINVLILHITQISANSGLAENTVTSFFQKFKKLNIVYKPFFPL